MNSDSQDIPGLVDVYPYRMVDDEPRFLLLRRSGDVEYAGQWRMVGGKVKQGETRVDAALREFFEETAQRPSRAWVVPSINTFYDHRADQIRYIPAFAFECGSTSLTLNHEHDAYDWFTLAQAEQLIGWYEQKKILRIIHDILTSNNVLTEWQLTV